MPNPNKPLYMPWNEDEFQGDLYVRMLTPIQKWMYRTLLQQMFFCPTRPYLPNDDNLLYTLAGCPDKQTWLNNKTAIIQLFGQVTLADGQKALTQGRVMMDWAKLEDLRENKKEYQRKYRKSKDKLSKVNISKGNVLVESTNFHEISTDTLEAGMAIATKISDSCLRILGIQAAGIKQLGNPTGDALKQSARIYGEEEVLTAFESWATEQIGTSSQYPVQEFVRIMDGILRGLIVSQKNPEVEKLGALLYKIGEQVFTNQQVAGLLKDYTLQEIANAYTEFVQKMDEFQLKYAVRNFCEGGASAIILTQRERFLEQEQAQQIIETAGKSLEAHVVDELIEAENKLKREKELIEERLE